MKPMLAASMNADKGQNIETLNYPVMASPKLDGIRCLIHNGKIMSRSLKPIPNRYINEILGRHIKKLEGLDGELMVRGTFSDVTSSIMSRDGEPEFIFLVFDWFRVPALSYIERVDMYQSVCSSSGFPEYIRGIQVKHCFDSNELNSHISYWLEQGFEGAIVRSSFAGYKFGRSTWKEGGMIKIKPFEDAEATIIGFDEQQSNLNEATVSELGRTKRSSHKANKHGKDTLGALVVKNKEFGTFRVGTGFDDALRKQIWNNPHLYIGEKITFRFQRIGTKDKPRIPSFKGFRHPHDL